MKQVNSLERVEIRAVNRSVEVIHSCARGKDL